MKHEMNAGESGEKPAASVVDGYLVIQSPGHQETWVTTADLLVTARECRYWLILLLLTSLCLSLVVGFVMTPIYQSEAVLLPVTEEGAGFAAGLQNQLGGLAALAGINLGTQLNEKRAEALAAFQSRKLAYGFVEDEDLLLVLFDDLWDDESSSWSVFHSKDVPTLEDAYEKLHEKILDISEDPRTGLITLSVRWKDAAIAASWVDKLVRRVNQTLREEAITQAQQNIDFLEKEVDKTNYVEIRRSLFELMEAQIQTMMVANVREQFAFKVIDPPQISDEDRYVRPNWALLVIGGALSGAIVALAIAFILTVRRKNAIVSGD